MCIQCDARFGTRERGVKFVFEEGRELSPEMDLCLMMSASTWRTCTYDAITDEAREEVPLFSTV